MEKLEDISKSEPNKAKIITKARATKLLTAADGAVVGVEYEKDGQLFQESGVVIIATGGYAADFTDTSLLHKFRPDICHLATTNGDHCTGDGVKMAMNIGANTVDMEMVQVHPTGLVDLQEPESKVKFLAAEALRGVGGLLLDNQGQRFCDELGHRDYVTGEMWKTNKAPYRLVLNGAGSKEIEWHCKHYVGRGLMKAYRNGAELAADMGIPVKVLEETFRKYNEIAKAGNDPYGKKYFDNIPFDINDEFHVAIVTPVLHYCMGGLEINAESAVVGTSGSPIPGLWATGEVCGGVHGANRLGGNSLLDCVVYGRVSGASACRYVLQKFANATAVSGDLAIGTVITQGSTQTKVQVDPRTNRLNIEITWNNGTAPAVQVTAPTTAAATASAAPAAVAPAAAAPAAAPAAPTKEYTLEEVAKHNTENDCWVIVNGQVLDVTSFLKDHPGGKKAILLYAGRDASSEFNMLHKPDVVDKYAPDSVIGVVKLASKL